MRSRYSFTFVALLGMVGTSFSLACVGSEKVNNNQQTLVLKITSLKPGEQESSHERHLVKSIRKIKGVDAVRLSGRTATLTIRHALEFDPKEIQNAVVRAGYAVVAPDEPVEPKTEGVQKETTEEEPESSGPDVGTVPQPLEVEPEKEGEPEVESQMAPEAPTAPELEQEPEDMEESPYQDY